MLIRLKQKLYHYFKEDSQSLLLQSVQVEKRKLLMAAVGLFGALPVMKVFKWGKSETPYILIVSMKSTYLNLMTKYKQGFDALNVKKLHQKKILKFRSYASKERIFFLYIFPNKKSRLEWGIQVNRQINFFPEELPVHSQYHKIEGFFNRDSFPDRISLIV